MFTINFMNIKEAMRSLLIAKYLSGKGFASVFILCLDLSNRATADNKVPSFGYIATNH